MLRMCLSRGPFSPRARAAQPRVRAELLVDRERRPFDRFTRCGSLRVHKIDLVRMAFNIGVLIVISTGFGERLTDADSASQRFEMLVGRHKVTSGHAHVVNTSAASDVFCAPVDRGYDPGRV